MRPCAYVLLVVCVGGGTAAPQARTTTSALARRPPPPPAGSVTDIPWTDVKVGDAILVRDEELFPSDLICLYSALPDKVCFIKTTNLDGETNLKIRKPLDLKGVVVSNIAGAMGLNVTLTAEGPNKNLHKFKGKAQIHNDEYGRMPLSPGSAETMWQPRDDNPGARAGGGGCSARAARKRARGD